MHVSYSGLENLFSLITHVTWSSAHTDATVFTLYLFISWFCFYFKEAAEGQLFGDLYDFAKSSVHAEPLESQYPHVKTSLQQGEACLTVENVFLGGLTHFTVQFW